MMTLNFCTVFDTGYLLKGLALHHSLMQVSPSFHLYIFALDEICYNTLTAEKLANVTIIKCDDFEDEQLLAVKNGRTISEYCWTCKPFILKYCFEHYNPETCTYLDADLYFYNDPKILFDEAGISSVIITPHNYYYEYDQSGASGIYCAQFIMFRNDANGMQVLNWWGNACLTWCFRYYEDGKWADQKYLDSWPYMFNNVHICRNKGAGLAPWNLLIFNYTLKDNKLLLNGNELIFFHFHDLKKLPGDVWHIGGYKSPDTILNSIYKPYIWKLIQLNKQLQLKRPDIDYLGEAKVIPDELRAKYKIGIYRFDLIRSSKLFFDSLLFISKRKYYKHNYISLKPGNGE